MPELLLKVTSYWTIQWNWELGDSFEPSDKIELKQGYQCLYPHHRPQRAPPLRQHLLRLCLHCISVLHRGLSAIDDPTTELLQHSGLRDPLTREVVQDARCVRGQEGFFQVFVLEY